MAHPIAYLTNKEDVSDWTKSKPSPLARRAYSTLQLNGLIHPRENGTEIHFWGGDSQ